MRLGDAPNALTRPCNRLNPHSRPGRDQNSHLCRFLCNWSLPGPDHLGNRTLRACSRRGRTLHLITTPRDAPMVSQAKIDANRRNAAKSTGPRTAKGKDKVKFNAVTHGMTAATVVLPHEDEQAYQHRLEAWTSELKAPRRLRPVPGRTPGEDLLAARPGRHLRAGQVDQADPGRSQALRQGRRQEPRRAGRDADRQAARDGRGRADRAGARPLPWRAAAEAGRP